MVEDHSDPVEQNVGVVVLFPLMVRDVAMPESENASLLSCNLDHLFTDGRKVSFWSFGQQACVLPSDGGGLQHAQYLDQLVGDHHQNCLLD
jgi:hypothetical protein